MGSLVERLRDNEFRFVERLLYDHEAHESSILELEAELYDLLNNLVPNPSVAKLEDNYAADTSESYSEPERYAVKCDEHLHVKFLRGRIEEKKRHYEAIHRARQCLSEDEMRFVRLFYDQGRSVRECKKIMAYEKSKMYNLRHSVVYKVANYIGLL